MPAATDSKSESEGVALWLHEMAERSGISTEDHIKLRYAAELISASSDAAAAASAMLAALEGINRHATKIGPDGSSEVSVDLPAFNADQIKGLARAAIAAAKAAGIEAGGLK